MPSIADVCFDFLKKYSVPFDGTVLVGLSGGIDSVVLTHVLKTLGLNVVALHLNHNWRKAQSQRDEEFSKNFAKKLGIEFYSNILQNDVKKTENAARQARYDFFSSAAKKYNSKYVFLAHNANDNAETVLYRAIKGTGLLGLCAIPEVRDIFFRPLLSVTRAEIEQYAKKNGLKWVYDSSNSDSKYKRNLIRNEIFPLLRLINPNVTIALNSLSNVSKFQYQIIENALNEAKTAVYSGDKIILEKFLELNYSLQLEIINDYLANDLKFRDFKRVKSYVDFILAGKKRKSVNSDTFLVVHNGCVYKTKKEKSNNNAPVIEITGEGIYDFLGQKIVIEKANNVKDFNPKDGTKFLNLDFSKKIILRTRKNGDKFSPFGLFGHKMKLKDYFINKKIPKELRQKLPLVVQGEEILCIIGVQISESAKTDGKNCYSVRVEDGR